MSKYLDLINENNIEKLKEPALVIKNGGIVVFPTETVYGIGTNAFNENAVRKLYDIKERPLNKPISLLVSDIEMAKKITTDITELEYKIMGKFFPGPLTLVLKKKDIIPDIVTSNFNTVGIRIPDNQIARKLIEYSGCPIATTSFNISGKPSSDDLNDSSINFENDVDYFIDGGKCKIGVASTVVQIIDGMPHILREGKIKENDILALL